MIPLPWKWLAGSAVVLAIIAAAYFAVNSYKSAITKNAQLTQQVAQLTANAKATQAQQALVANTVDKNQTQTTRIITRVQKQEEAINALPITNACAQSAPIQLVLSQLRESATSNASGSSGVSPGPVPVSGQAQPQ